MLVSWELLKDLIELDVAPERAADRLTAAGAEVEAIHRPIARMRGIVVAKIDRLEAHPTDARLYVAHIDAGAGSRVCITSATNVKAGDRVLYASPGSTLPDGTELGTRAFSGVESEGMMLSASELGVPDAGVEDGLLVLPTDAPIGSDAASLYHIGDTILDVSITPNRGDLLSLLGMARELAGLFPGSCMRTPAWLDPLRQSVEWSETFGSISLPDPGCLCYRLGLATGVTIGPSPLTVRFDLCHMGMRPISNVVDATNYVMLMMGQPLHAFDLDTLPARDIEVRAARDGEIMITLDGKERLLTERDMLITSGGEAIALAGVMGGQQTGIRPGTHTVVVESASFAAHRVGHTSRRLGIASEAAFRFARAVDPELNGPALSAALSLMREWCDADISCRPLSAENERVRSKPVTLTRKKLSTVLSWGDGQGEMDEAAKILEGFGIACVEKGEDACSFLPPTWRPDVAIEEDLIEEIGRFRGYDDVEGQLPGPLSRRADAGLPMRLAAFVRDALVARGYIEIMTYSFLPEGFPERILIPEDDLRADPLVLANPISRDQSAMRTTLVPGLLSALRTSLSSGWRGAVRIFEQGRAFLRAGQGHVEVDRVAGLVFNGADPRTPWKDQEEGLLSIKADVSALIESRGLVPRFVAGREPFAHGGQTADVLVAREGGDARIGWMARLKPTLEQELDAAGPVWLFELDLALLEEPRLPSLHPTSSFPASLRDVSMLVPLDRTQEQAVADIRASAREAAGWDILESVRLFDIYDGKGIPEGQRSMAWSLAYRAPDRTLKDEEVEAVHSSVREALAKKGYGLR